MLCKTHKGCGGLPGRLTWFDGEQWKQADYYCETCGMRAARLEDFELDEESAEVHLVSRRTRQMVTKIAATAHQLQELLDASEDREALVWAHGFLVGLADRIGKRIFAAGSNWSRSSGTIPTGDLYVDDFYKQDLIRKCRKLGLPDPKFGSYTLGFDRTKPHPFSTSTGCEGRCELCSDGADGKLHQQFKEA